MPSMPVGVYRDVPIICSSALKSDPISEWRGRPEETAWLDDTSPRRVMDSLQAISAVAGPAQESRLDASN